MAEAAAGVKMSDFKALKEKPQAEIDKAGQKTLVGNWAANLKLAGKPQEYKYTLVRNNNVRFAKTACFVAGTKVWLHDYSQKNIEDVLPEDTVRAFDAITKQEVLGRVTHTIIKQSSTLIGVYTIADTLWVTPEHPFYVNGRWIPAGNLKKGYKLTLLDQSQFLAHKTRHLPRSNELYVDSIVVKDTVAIVYNFTVAKHHNYYVGDAGVLVHNNDCDNLWDRFANHQNLSKVKIKVQGWKDTKLEKVFVDDMGDKNLAKKVFGDPILVEGWKELYIADEKSLKTDLGTLQRVADNIEVVRKVGGYNTWKDIQVMVDSWKDSRKTALNNALKSTL